MISFNYKILGAVLDTGLSGVVVGATQRENKRETETRQTEEATAVFTSITVMGSSSRIRIQEHNPIADSSVSDLLWASPQRDRKQVSGQKSSPDLEDSRRRSKVSWRPDLHARVGGVKIHQPRTIRSTCFCCCCLVAQSCPTLCDPMDCSPPGSSVHGILQTRIQRSPIRSTPVVKKSLFFFSLCSKEDPLAGYLQRREVEDRKASHKIQACAGEF